MNAQDKADIREIITSLNVPRNRFGKLDGPHNNNMQTIAQRRNLPHGGLDRIDQAVMVLQSMIGETPTSIWTPGGGVPKAKKPTAPRAAFGHDRFMSKLHT